MSVSPANAGRESKGIDGSTTSPTNNSKRSTERQAKDTLGTHEAGVSTTDSLIACAQNFFCGIWSCITGFFGCIASWVTGPGYTDPELLANPLKQIERDLVSLRTGKGHFLGRFMDKMRATNDRSLVSWALHLEVYRGGQLQTAHKQAFTGWDDMDTWEQEFAKTTVYKYEKHFEQFIEQAKEKFAGERYIDLKHDTVIIKLMGVVDDPKTHSHETGSITYKNNFACVISTWGQESAQLTAYKRDYNYQNASGGLAVREKKGLPQNISLDVEPAE